MNFEYSQEVKLAKRNNIPIIALESTIISHGMPYPQNLNTAYEIQEIVKANDCCPATISLSEGKIHIGADSDQIDKLAKSVNVQKVTTRDIGRILVSGQSGATTVAATMYCAYLAGIKVFATGGIGGVHKNAETSFDISADLYEMSKTPLIVISAGVKAILDISKTLEYLESSGVPVYGYQTEYFPGFYSTRTPWKIEKINEVKQIANIYKKQLELGLSSALLIANPVPEKYDIPWDKIKKIIDLALRELDKSKITGKAVTPFLLKKITEITKGKSLETNIALVKNNIKLACKIASELKK